MTDSIKIKNCADRIYFSEITHDMFSDHRLPNHGMMMVRSGVLAIETEAGWSASRRQHCEALSSLEA